MMVKRTVVVGYGDRGTRLGVLGLLEVGEATDDLLFARIKVDVAHNHETLPAGTVPCAAKSGEVLGLNIAEHLVLPDDIVGGIGAAVVRYARSEERRVGQECRS